MAQDDLIEAMRRALEKPGKTQRGLAEAIDRSESVVTKILQGHRLVKAAELPKIREYLELSGSGIGPHAFGLTDSNQEFTPVPVYDIRASAGAGAIATTEGVRGRMMFDVSWLRRVSPRPEILFVIEIAGDSGWPTLHDGDHALVDPGQIDARREGLYVIRIEDALQVKRLSMHPVSMKVTVKSENPAYPSFADIDPEQLALLGRVVWIGRRL